MKLLFVVNVDWFFCSHRLPIAIGARKCGYEVHIATTFTSSHFKDKLLGCGFILHDLVIDRSGRNPLGFFENFFRIYRICSAVRPDLVHLVTIQPILIGSMAARFAGVKNFVFAISGLGHVFIGNSLVYFLRRVLVKLLYRLAFQVDNCSVIFQNSVDLSRLQSFCSLSKKQCFILPGSGVNLSFFVEKPLPSGCPVVLMASRLLSTKGVREFVEAAAILQARGTFVKFKLVGEPDSSNPAAIPLDELNMWRKKGWVEILGHRTDMNDVMSNSHIVCLPSYYPEGLPKVLCEAAACGRAVVTTDEPGCRDSIQTGVTGMLVPSRDPIALADTIGFLLSRPDLIRAMGNSGRKHAEKLFDVQAIVETHLHIYSSLLRS